MVLTVTIQLHRGKRRRRRERRVGLETDAEYHHRQQQAILHHDADPVLPPHLAGPRR